MHFPRALSMGLSALLLLAPLAAHALFKVVGPDGKVTYTDRPPLAGEGKVVPISRDSGQASEPTLPVALRQVAARFPVTLFTMNDCGEACNMARAMLARRGIPYAERMAETVDDRDAWPNLVGGVEAPVLRVGDQSLRGFVPASWEETLDVAGYPRQSQLPGNYQQPAAVPLVARRTTPTRPPPAVPVTPDTAPSAPPGIRF